MTNISFIGNLIPEFKKGSIQVPSYAAQYYQEKVVQACSFDKVFSINYNKENIVYDTDKFIYIFLSKRTRLINVFKSILIIIRRVKSNNKIIFYNLNYRNFLVLECLKLFKHCRCYVIVADYEHLQSIKFLPRRILQYFINSSIRKSSGVLALNSNINIHTNTIYQAALVKHDLGEEHILKNTKVEPNTILFSGSIGIATGIDIAIRALSLLPEYKLYITGSLYDINDSKLLSLINNGNAHHNIFYLGVLKKQDYLLLLAKSEYGLSLRNIDDLNHQFNFPSKIAEYLSFNKKVISTITYDCVSDLIYMVDYTPESIVDKIKATKLFKQCARAAVLERFGFDRFRFNISKLIEE